MDTNVLARYKTWIYNPYFDEVIKEELLRIQGKENEIEDRFFKDLEFGTAGLRGIIGAGTNRMNKYTVRKASQGLSDYIQKNGEVAKNRGVVIAYDSRRMSKEFAEEAAMVLTGNRIKTYLFQDLRSTPELSFVIRYLNCISGIVITASHNPREYNGYKVYWEDGAQISSEVADGIIEAIDGIKDFYCIKMLSLKEAIEKSLLVYLNSKIDDAYIEEVKKQSIRSDVVKKVADEFKVIFTPLHGTGNIPVRRILDEIGFKNIMVVPEQEMPNSEFPTVKYPNPEEKKAFTMAIGLAKKENADLIIGTDPDCDRVGAVVKNNHGEYMVLTGNQTGALLVNYMLSSMKEKNKLKENSVIVKTIVTSEMGAYIAKEYGVEIINTLTGFKYIGEKIKEFEDTGVKTFLFGYEESYGYLAGTHARDKDAVVASMLICEMAAYYYSKGMNLYEALTDLYHQYGYFVEGLKSLTLEGIDGLNRIKNIMTYFRNHQMEKIADKKVECIEDYMQQKRMYTNGQDVEVMDLPKADVIKFILEDGWIALRPSGTEPKLKIYGGFKEESLREANVVLEKSMAWVEEIIEKIH